MNILEQHVLPRLSREQMIQANADVAIGRKVYEIGEMQATIEVGKEQFAWVDLIVEIHGNPVKVGVSRETIAKLLQKYNTSFAELSKEWLLVLLQSTQIEGARIIGLADENQYRRVFVFRQYGGELTQFAIGADDDSVLAVLEAFVVGVAQSPLQLLPIPMPLIASTIELDGQSIAQLGVGDLLLVG